MDEDARNEYKEAHELPTADYADTVLRPDAQIGQFRIKEQIGRGAMGIVYLAHDSKLKREVAIKSLPAEVTSDRKARSRFSREARLLASLNHPNIATIYDQLEEVDGTCYLVLEYVPGQTLAERITKGGLRLQEVFSIALQITDAVAAAHDHGVIHRDLKPGNIKITPGGEVKVLDFGLARAVGGEAVDKQSTVTEPGRVIGTPAYMSPEQARGQETDKRSDIWGFGCILYEMLTAMIPFRGETISDTLANILQTEPDWQTLPGDTPVNIRSLLRRCLNKDPRRRLQHIGDAGIEIRETLADFESGKTTTAPVRSTSRTPGLRRMTAWTLFCILVGAVAATLLTWNLKRPVPMPSSRFPISLPRNQELKPDIAISPDGKRLVYEAGVGSTGQLFLWDVGQDVSKKLEGTKGGYRPFFSPDGRSIGFWADGKLKTLSLDGGKPNPLCDVSILGGGSWAADGTIYFSPLGSEGLWKISADGGVREVVTTPNGDEDEFAHLWPEVLPGGKFVLFTIWKTTLKDVSVAALSLETGQIKTILVGGSYGRYAPTGHLLYVRSGTLMAAPFDVKQLKVGEPRRVVVEGLNQDPGDGHAPFCFSQDGLLYYVRGGDWLARNQLAWVDRHGVAEPLPLPEGSYSYPRISSDGKRLAFTQFEFEGGIHNVWAYDLPSGPPRRLTDKSSNFLPLWTPGDNTLTFTSFRAGPFDVYKVSADKGSDEEPLLVVEGPRDQMATSWSSDGKLLLYTEVYSETGKDIVLLSIEDGNTPKPLLRESWGEMNAVFSPKGNWIAYQSDGEGGLNEVWVISYPGGDRRKISTGGGSNPVWSRDGKELFYRSGNKMVAVSLETEPEFRVVSSKVLFEGKPPLYLGPNYDVSNDGQRFLMVKDSEGQPGDNQLVVVLNWFEELKRLVPIKSN